jgi:hypothetical protein
MNAQPTLAIDCTEHEAWQLIRPLRPGEDWRTIYLSDRSEDPEFADDFQWIKDQEGSPLIAFHYRGDHIVTAAIMDAITPEELAADSAVAADVHDARAAQLAHRLDLDADTYEILEPDHTGLAKDRLEASPEFSRMEKIFAEEWIIENQRHGLNHGLLQDLLRDHTHHDAPRFQGWGPQLLNNRERRIAATVIQWLGTNVGMAFLHRVNRSSGHTLALHLDSRPIR